MTFLIFLFSLLSVILASPQGYFGGYGGRGGTISQIPGQRVYGVPGANVGSRNFGRFEGQGANEGKRLQVLGHNAGFNGGTPRFNIGGLKGQIHPEFDLPGPNSGGQRKSSNFGLPGGFKAQEGYDSRGPQGIVQNAGINGGYPVFNNGGGFRGHKGYEGTMDEGLNGGHPRFGSQGVHDFNIGFGGQGGYVTTGPQVIVQNEGRNVGAAAFNNGGRCLSYMSQNSQSVGQNNGLKGGLPGFNNGGRFGSIYGVPGTNVAVQNEQSNNGSPGGFGVQGGYVRTSPQVGQFGQNEVLTGINNGAGISEFPVYRCVWCSRKNPFRSG